MNRAELAHAVLLWEAIAARAGAEAATARAALEADARAELERDGTAPTWRIPGLATVPLGTTKPRVDVVDGDAYMVWLLDRYPDEVQPSVRPAFDIRLRAEAAKLGDPVDPRTGELIPGLRFVPGGQAKGVSVRAADGVKERMAAEAGALLGLDPPLGADPDVMAMQSFDAAERAEAVDA